MAETNTKPGYRGLRARSRFKCLSKQTNKGLVGYKAISPIKGVRALFVVD